MDEIDPESLGWIDGYEDKMSDCPYEEGTPEYDEYFKGYAQGCMDC